MIIKANAAHLPIADKSIHCCVTSPPYWGLRKYSGEQETEWPDGLCAYGLEPTIEQYVEHSVLILREVRRVLRDDGVCWWNLGDSYSGSGAGGGGNRKGNEHGQHDAFTESGRPRDTSLKPLDLCLIPERVALAAQADGWYVRSLVIWAKPNPMPQSVRGWDWERHRVKVKSGRYDSGEKQAHTNLGAGFNQRERGEEGWSAQWADCPGCDKCSENDGLVLRKGSWRPTDAYEHILMLTKTADYFGDAEAVKEAAAYGRVEIRGQWRGGAYVNQHEPTNNSATYQQSQVVGTAHPESGRNLRNVWDFTTEPNTLAECENCHFVYDSKRNLPWKYVETEAGKRKIYQCVKCKAWDQWGEHFASFPQRLPEICIKASTSERGCCPKCGANWARVIKKPSPPREVFGKSNADIDELVYKPRINGEKVSAGQKYQNWRDENPAQTLGWRPSCQCGAVEPVPCTILDPFGGSGTTARVAMKLNRRAISVDLAYHKLARKRTSEVQPQLVMA